MALQKRRRLTPVDALNPGGLGFLLRATHGSTTTQIVIRMSCGHLFWIETIQNIYLITGKGTVVSFFLANPRVFWWFNPNYSTSPLKKCRLMSQARILLWFTPAGSNSGCLLSPTHQGVPTSGVASTKPTSGPKSWSTPLLLQRNPIFWWLKCGKPPFLPVFSRFSINNSTCLCLKIMAKLKETPKSLIDLGLSSFFPHFKWPFPGSPRANNRCAVALPVLPAPP